jgi:hypothetical protein
MAGVVSPVKSDDQPKVLLKNVSLVPYKLAAAPNKGRCAIDVEAWSTAIDFVANQSTTLKLIREQEHYERAKELSDKANEAARKYFAARSHPDVDAAGKALEEAKENHSKYFSAPKLLLAADGMFEHNGSCVGTLSATVTALLKQSEMISTGKVVHLPFLEIWSRSTVLAGPPSSFSRFVIETSEGMMKGFVNDWTLSQKLFSP